MTSGRLLRSVLTAGIAAAILGVAGCASTSRSIPAAPPPPEPSTESTATEPPPPEPSGASAESSGPGEAGSVGPPSGSENADRPTDVSATESAPPPGVGRTEGERQAEMDQQLQRSLSEFDRMLLEEQRQIERQRAASIESGGGSADRTGGATGPHDPSSPAGEHPSSADGGGVPARAGSGAAPPGTPDGSDDDIVARQLREAAEKEQDPELRAKLWEEYRKYKENARRRDTADEPTPQQQPDEDDGDPDDERKDGKEDRP